MRAILSMIFVIMILIPVQSAGNVPMLFYGEAKEYTRGGLTASGERFAANSLTGAHKNLPFGSLVRVTNLENDKHITVRINDRTATGGRAVLNLTKAAAVLLGFRQNAKVEVQVIKVAGDAKTAVIKKNPQPVQKTLPNTTVPNTTVPNTTMDNQGHNSGNVSATEKYHLQVGAFRRKINADAFAAKLRGLGYSITVRVQSSGFHRVLVGPFTTREAASTAKSALSSEAPTAFIRKG